MLWHAGQQLRVIVSGRYLREPGWYEPFAWDLRNKGEHIIHTGGRYDSHLLVPVIPSKYKHAAKSPETRVSSDYTEFSGLTFWEALHWS